MDQTLLQPSIILSAFRKTGVWPYDPTVVTMGMMAPSLETSQQVTLPIVPPTPVRIVTQLIHAVSEPNTPRHLTAPIDHSGVVITSVYSTPPSISSEFPSATAPLVATPAPTPSSSTVSTELIPSSAPDEPPSLTHMPVRWVLTMLESMTAGFLVSSSPVNPRTIVLLARPAPITPKVAQGTRYKDLLDVVPQMQREQLLQQALHDTEAREAAQKERVIALQASLVLLQKYCDRVRGQLETQQKKKKKRKN